MSLAINLLAGASAGPEELFEPLLERALTGHVLLERIVSSGQITPPGQWYDQAWDEWILLLQGQAQLIYASGEAFDLSVGDSLLIPAHCRHRVAFTSQEPVCIWLALHLKG